MMGNQLDLGMGMVVTGIMLGTLLLGLAIVAMPKTLAVRTKGPEN